MICRICNREFTPNKYRLDQKICSNPECQRQRQLQNMKDWRKNNPYYFIYGRYRVDWKGDYKKHAKDWRMRHPEYMKRYAQEHKEDRRTYMREYMRWYRKKTVS